MKFEPVKIAQKSHSFIAIQWIGGVVVAILFMGSTLLTPLYELYQNTYGLDSLQLTLIYAVYVIGNLTALLFLGQLSDQLGRRPIIFVGLGLAALSAILFLFAVNQAWLYAGRIISGCAVGMGSGATTAWITESLAEPRRPLAASIMTAFNFAGITLGPIVSGFLVQYAPWPLHLSFVVYLGLLVIVTALVFIAPETLQRANAAINLKPHLGVPSNMRLAFVAPAAAGFAAMSLVGYYAAVGPSMIHQTLEIKNRALSGVMIAELFAVSTITILITREIKPRLALFAGLIATPFGLAALITAQTLSSLPLMLAGMTISGVAAALSYRAGLSVINAMAPSERRAEVTSAYFICCFLGNALPIVGVGALSQRLNPAFAARAFSVGISAIAITAFVMALLFHGKKNITL